MNLIDELQWNDQTKKGFINLRPCCAELWNKIDMPPIWRCGALENINDDIIKKVTDILKINKWYYLGTHNELQKSSVNLSDTVEQMNFPLQEEVGFRCHSQPSPHDYLNLYWHYLSECTDQIKAFFEDVSLLKPMQRILISCYAGKDRTGVLCLLLSSLLTTNRRIILEDFCLSSYYLFKQIDFFKQNWQKRNIDKSTYAARFTEISVSAEMLMDRIYSEFGGPREYLLSIGVTQMMINKIQNHFSPFIIKQGTS